MLAFSVPPGYRQSRPPARPNLDPFTGLIDGILTQDEGRPRKQRHTSKRIFEHPRGEHGYAGGITIVKDYVWARRLRQREVFVPLRHDPGHAQADFDEALAQIAGMERKIHFFAVDLPHSDACLCRPTRRRRRKRSVTATTPRSPSPARSRARSCTTTPSWRWPVSWAMGAPAHARVQRAAVPLSVCRPVRASG
jgi:transposase